MLLLCFGANIHTTKTKEKAQEDKAMTRFEIDLKEARDGDAIIILRERKEEIERLIKEGKACKNGFRRQYLAQEVVRLTREYNKIAELV